MMDFMTTPTTLVDELDKILIKFANSMTTNNAPSYGSMPNDGKILGKAKAAINAYTTNKIRDAEYRLALTVRQQLGSGIADYGDLPRPDLEKLVKAVVELLDDRIKALNHRKER